MTPHNSVLPNIGLVKPGIRVVLCRLPGSLMHEILASVGSLALFGQGKLSRSPAV